ncbi:MAG: tetratricopeptide repeat protein, partial [Acidisphaera sp.]|nr:tetratricopeptide repeat protein [Acidisphaera sp.]
MRKLVLFSIIGILVAGGAGAAALYYMNNRVSHYDLAIQAMRAGDLKRAQIQLRNAVRDNPNSADAHLQLATVELRVGDPAAAEKDFRDALALGADPAV